MAVMLDGKNITSDCIWADTDKGAALVIMRMENLLPLSEWDATKSKYVPKSELLKGEVVCYQIASPSSKGPKNED